MTSFFGQVSRYHFHYNREEDIFATWLK